MTPSGNPSGGANSRGIFTDGDRVWLKGSGSNVSDQKTRCKRRFRRAMQDIETLVEMDLEDVSNLDSAGELFEDAAENTGQSREACARSLIALAFIITSDGIDYAEIAEQMELHPRSEEDRPTSQDRPTAGGPTKFSQPIEPVLGFRNALTSGIRLGKERYDDVPETVLIDSNTKLYKEPTKKRLNDPDRDIGVSTEDWRDAIAKSEDAAPRDGETSHPDIRDKHRPLRFEIEGNIAYRLAGRRERSRTEIRRHDMEI